MDNPEGMRRIIDLRQKNITASESVSPGDIVLLDKDDYLFRCNDDGSFTVLGHPDKAALAGVAECTMVGCREPALGEFAFCVKHALTPEPPPAPPNETTTKGEPIPVTED